MDRFDIDNDSLALVLTWSTSGNRYQSRKILVDGEVEQELRSIAKQMLSSIPSAPRKYDPDSEPDGEECVQVAQTELFDTNLLKSIKGGPSLDAIDQNEVRERQRYFCYSIVLGPGNDPDAVFIKKTNPVKRATKRWYANFSNGALHRIENPEFEIEADFDMLIVPDETIIAWDQRAFEGLFKTAEAVTVRVAEWIEGTVSCFGDVTIDYEVHKTLAISNTFRRRKWQSVHSFTKSFPVDQQSIMIAIQEAEVPGELFFEDGKLKITEENVDDFLGLVNEDYFKGAMSGRKLRAQRKSIR